MPCRRGPDERVELDASPRVTIAPRYWLPVFVDGPLAFQRDHAVLVLVAQIMELSRERLQLRNQLHATAYEALSSIVNARPTIVGVFGLAGRERTSRLGDAVDVLELGAQFALLEVDETGVAPRLDAFVGHAGFPRWWEGI